MPSLWQRVVGDLTPLEADLHIPVQHFTDALILWGVGEIAKADIVAEWGLDAAQEAALDVVKNNYNAATSKISFVFGIQAALRQGEQGVLGYRDEAAFVATMNALAV